MTHYIYNKSGYKKRAGSGTEWKAGGLSARHQVGHTAVNAQVSGGPTRDGSETCQKLDKPIRSLCTPGLR